MDTRKNEQNRDPARDWGAVHDVITQVMISARRSVYSLLGLDPPTTEDDAKFGTEIAAMLNADIGDEPEDFLSALSKFHSGGFVHPREVIMSVGQPLKGEFMWANPVRKPHPYAPLRRVLELAYEQSASGKGRDRHANGRPFIAQPIMEIGRMVGVGGHAYQICKKAQEAVTMAERQNFTGAKAEVLGAIVYSAAAYLLLEEAENRANAKNSI